MFSQVKLLSFQWTGGEGATHVRVSRLIDGQPSVVVDDIPGTETGYDLEVFLPEQLEARYVVAACNAGGCTSSPEIAVQREALDAGIGYVKSPAPGGGDLFGTAVALSADGKVLAVGAPAEDGSGSGVDPPIDEGLNTSGAVYVYMRTAAGTWGDATYIKAPVPGAFDEFGSALSLSGDGTVLAVGAPGESGGGSGINPPHDDALSNAGAVYVYERSSEDWELTAYIKAAEVDSGDLFGSALALSDDGTVLAVGAHFEAGSGAGINPPVDDSLSSAGAAYVFERTTAGVWLQTAYVKASDPDEGDRFGYSLALSGDGRVLAVGAYGEDGSGAGVDPPEDDALPSAGAVWVYVQDDAGVWSSDAYLKANNPGQSDAFGLSVALDGQGGILAVGAYAEAGSGIGIGSTPDDLAPGTGAVYVFARDPAGGWMDAEYLKPGRPSPNSNFGSAVDWSGDGSVLVVAAAFADEGGTGINPSPGVPNSGGSGAVWEYERRPGGVWSDGILLKASNNGSADHFGSALALSSSGETLAVGAPLEDGGQAGIGGDQNDNTMPFAGAVYLY